MHLVGFITKNFVTMQHCHTNVKKLWCSSVLMLSRDKIRAGNSVLQEGRCCLETWKDTNMQMVWSLWMAVECRRILWPSVSVVSLPPTPLPYPRPSNHSCQADSCYRLPWIEQVKVKLLWWYLQVCRQGTWVLQAIRWEFGVSTGASMEHNFNQ